MQCEIRKYGPEKMTELARIMAQTITFQPNFVTFSRGGIWATALVSGFLSYRPKVLVLDIKYGPTSLGILREIESIQYHNSTPYVVLDDLIDTGATIGKFDQLCDLVGIQRLRAYFLTNKVASNGNPGLRVYDPPSLRRYTFCAEHIQTDDWISYFWEEPPYRDHDLQF